MTPRALRSLIRRQDIVYRVPGTRWDEALPAGDGCFGAMQYEEDGAFQWTLNHLDLYHAPLHITEYPTPTFDLADIRRQAEAAHRDPSHPAHQNYNHILSPSAFAGYGWQRRGMRMNLGAHFRIVPRQPPRDAAQFEQRLDLHDAVIETHCRWADGEVRLRAFVAQGSRTLVIEVECSRPGLIKKLGLARIPSPHSTAPKSGTAGADLWLTDTYKPVNPTLSPHVTAAVVARRIGSIRVSRRFTVLLTIAVEEATGDALAAARRTLAESQSRGVAQLRRQHEQHWHSFWGKSQIELADKFLEKLWYVNLYALACCDGTGTRWKAQATGLNGLWDIKQPDGWGSCWYWDVNIQEAYWASYTANHLEMTQPFYDGLREYVSAARRWAREWYGMRGIAGDFPFPFYHCIWPWCCQFLWWGYRYSMDEKFLREVAYPIMREVLEFFEDCLPRALPSVSPEQGPLGKNPTILLASLRYLLQAGIAASRVLQRDAPRWEKLLRRLPNFPTGESAQFGETFKDSEWATPALSLAHPSVLMPIYPTGLIGPDSSRQWQQIARNTLKYAETLQAIGTFNFGWLSACASRLGLGDEAARLIYEKGVAHLLRPNGLMAEETDRFIQNCHVLSDPLYLPPMSECSGGMIGAINEMLLQSRDGKVRVFPAVPTKWTHARFVKLLAEGALEVSAEWRDGRTVWVQAKSLKGGNYQLVVNGRVLTLHLPAGEERVVCSDAVRRSVLLRPDGRTTNAYLTPSNRRVFLGRDAETEYLRTLDDFLFDYHVGDIAVPRQTKYKFDFGPSPVLPKKYASVIPQQLFNKNKLGSDFYHIHPDTLYSVLHRYGWKKDFRLRAIDRRRPDDLRRDFISGTNPASFCLELPRGQYQLLFLLGDASAETSMSIEVPYQFRWRTSPPLRAGQFSVQVFPVRMEQDGILTINFAGIGKTPWKLNVLLVNRVP